MSTGGSDDDDDDDRHRHVRDDDTTATTTTTTTTTDVVYDSIRNEYRDMAGWYDDFWGSTYVDVTVRMALDWAYGIFVVADVEDARRNRRGRVRRRRIHRADDDAITTDAADDDDGDYDYDCGGVSSTSTRAVTTLVDVGCGTGTLLRRLRDRLLAHHADVVVVVDDDDDDDATSHPPIDGVVARLIGVDPSREMLDVARKKLDGGGGGEGGGGGGGGGMGGMGCARRDGLVSTRFVVSPAEIMPLNDDIANVVVCTNAFHFFRHRDRSMREIERILRPGGKLMIVDWCADYRMVRLYHTLERMRWNDHRHLWRWWRWSWWRWSWWRSLFWGVEDDGVGSVDRYPSPMTSVELRDVASSSACEMRVVEHAIYRVWIFGILPWGMQSIVVVKGGGGGGGGGDV